MDLAGRTYLERGSAVTVLCGWGPGAGPRNVAIRRKDGSVVVRPFRGLRRMPRGVTDADPGQSTEMSEPQHTPPPVAPTGEPLAGTEPAEEADTVGDEVREDPGSAGDTAVVEDGQEAVAPVDPDVGNSRT